MIQTLLILSFTLELMSVGWPFQTLFSFNDTTEKHLGHSKRLKTYNRSAYMSKLGEPKTNTVTGFPEKKSQSLAFLRYQHLSSVP